MKNLLENYPKCEEKNSAETMAAGVDSFSNPNAEIMKQIQKEQAEKELEAKKNAAKIQLQKDSFEQEYKAIEYRRENNKTKAKNEALKARTAENDAYYAGGVETDAHQKRNEKIETELREKLGKIDDEFNKAYLNLRSKNPDGYRYSSVRNW